MTVQDNHLPHGNPKGIWESARVLQRGIELAKCVALATKPQMEETNAILELLLTVTQQIEAVAICLTRLEYRVRALERQLAPNNAPSMARPHPVQEDASQQSDPDY